MIRLNTKMILAVSLSILFSLNLPVLAEPVPRIVLFGYHGEPRETHTFDDPLLLSVSIANQAAIMATRDNLANKEMLDAFRQTDEYKNISEQERQSILERYKQLTIPEFALGSDEIALATLIKFAVVNEKGESVQLDTQPLASNPTKKQTTQLTIEQPQLLRFGVSSQSLNQLTEGDYRLTAILDTSKRAGMWQGLIESRPLILALRKKHPDTEWAGSEERAQMRGEYLLETKQFNEAERHALQTIAQHPDTISAWTQLGEALAGKDNVEEALAAFNTALSQFRLAYGDNPPERPWPIIRKIDQLEGK